MKLWKVAPLDKQEAVKIQTEYGLPAIIAMLLQIRHITSKSEIEDFLANDSEIDNPFEIKDMDKAVERIKQAVENCELICVYGDYDADGVTSTTLMYSYLELIGANAMFYIPSRESEGYGMNCNAVDYLHEKGVDLIITVDNGIAAAKEIDYAAKLGIDTVVTDHHMPVGELPNACAVVDLHRADCTSRFKQLSGVGVAFKVIMAMEGEYCDVNSLLDNYSDLVALGTIGDVVELKSENRIFVKHGIKNINSNDRIGLNSLKENAGLFGKTINAGDVAFKLVPRINAAGRLGISQKSVSLFLTEDANKAEEISSQLCVDNTERQTIEKDILNKIDEKIRANPKLVLNRVIVIDGENWHQGVIGIVASRIKEIYGKPTIIISRNGDEAKASGRSVEGFPLCDAVFACAEMLTHYGGHPMAVGLSLESKNIELFRTKINDWALSYGDMPFDTLNIDCKLNPASLNIEIAKSLEVLQPFGAGNPTPIFGLYNMTLKNIIPMSNNKHLRLILARSDTEVTVLKFFTSSDEFPYNVGDVLDLAVILGVNEYNGNVSLSITAKDIKPSLINSEKLLEYERAYEDLCLGMPNPRISELLPTRDEFALLYRYLRNCGEYTYSVDNLTYSLDNKINFGKIKVILEAMRELGLIEISQGLYDCRISLLNVNGRVELSSAAIIKRLREMLL